MRQLCQWQKAMTCCHPHFPDPTGVVKTRVSWSDFLPPAMVTRHSFQDDPFLDMPAPSRAFTSLFLSQFYLHESLPTSLFPFGHCGKFLKSKYSNWGTRRYVQSKTSGYAAMYGSQGWLLPHVCLLASHIFFKTFRFVGMIAICL